MSDPTPTQRTPDFDLRLASWPTATGSIVDLSLVRREGPRGGRLIQHSFNYEACSPVDALQRVLSEVQPLLAPT